MNAAGNGAGPLRFRISRSRFSLASAWEGEGGCSGVGSVWVGGVGWGGVGGAAFHLVLRREDEDFSLTLFQEQILKGGGGWGVGGV